MLSLEVKSADNSLLWRGLTERWLIGRVEVVRVNPMSTGRQLDCPACPPETDRSRPDQRTPTIALWPVSPDQVHTNYLINTGRMGCQRLICKG